jgi:MIP family channel proteins
MNPLPKPLIAEFIGTFALIFIGAGAGAILGPGQVVGVALAHGLTIMIFGYAYGEISGGHVNPAVTIGLFAAGRFAGRNVVPYVAAQLAGAIVAAFALLAVLGGPVNNLGATTIDLHRTTVLGGMLLEAIGTFFLVNTVATTTGVGAAGRLAPFAIGMTVAICILGFGPLTGGSVNPARTIGPAIASGVTREMGDYIAAQLFGGVAAGLLYRLLWAASIGLPRRVARPDAAISPGR